MSTTWRTLHGDLDPLSAVWSHRPDVSNLSSAGGRVDGWNEVYADFQSMPRLYPGGRIAPRGIIVIAGRDMGHSVCTETGQLRSPEGPMVSFNQRATNIFRLEEGKWKLIGLLPNLPPIISRVRRFFRPPGAFAFPVFLAPRTRSASRRRDCRAVACDCNRIATLRW